MPFGEEELTPFFSSVSSPYFLPLLLFILLSFCSTFHGSTIVYCSKGFCKSFPKGKNERPGAVEIFLIMDYCAYLGNSKDMYGSMLIKTLIKWTFGSGRVLEE